MATIQSAKEKYARNSAGAAAAYNAAKGRMPAAYQEGMSRFLGAPVSGYIMQRYQSGIGAAQYRPGDPEVWARRLIARMTG